MSLHFTLSKSQTRFAGAFLVVTLLAAVFVWRQVLASNILWSSAGGSAWLTAGNWTGGAVPTGTDVAQFGTNPTAASGVGINFNGTTNAGTQVNGQKIEEVGAVEITSARAAAILIGDSSTTAGATGMFRLNGAAVNSVAHVILRNNSSQLFTIQNTQGSGNQTMSVLLNDTTDNLINIDGTGGITISSIINNAGGNHITLGGAGSGTLTLSGANTYTGGTTINSAKATATVNSALGTGNVNVNTTGVGLTLQGSFNNYLADAATVNIASGAMMALNQTGGSDTVAGLVLGGVTQTTPGTYGSSASGAANQSNTFFSGTGTLTLVGGGPTPTLNIGDVTMAEGNAGTTNFIFNVSLTQPAGISGVTFQIDTADGTTNPANAGSDYVAIVAGPGSITSGNSSTTVTVQVNGDNTPEANETFFVNISNIVGATAGDTQGLGTITNDDVVLVKIHDIQGSGNASPLSGSVTTSGIVTGVRSNGFFIQEPDATVDADPNTSEGIFVFTSSAPPAAAVVGNSVQVQGTISEFVPSTDTFSPSQTELTSPTTTLILTGNPLPTPHTITAAETQSPNDYNNLEKYEGMRVTVPSMTAISGTQGTLTESSATSVSTGIFYGVVTGVPRPFREPGIELPDTVPTPYPSGSAPANVPRFDFNPERLRVNSKAFTGSTILDVVSGQVITGITGPLDYGFRTYTIDTDATSVTPAPVISGPSLAVPVPTPTANELTISSFNMQRFFDTTDDPSTSDVVLTSTAFNGRLSKASLAIRNVLKSPDVIAVEEMEGGPAGTPASEAGILQQVADKVNTDAATPGDYQAYLARGNDVGGINVGFLVRSSRITAFSVTQYNKSETFIDPSTSSSALLNDRPPLVLRGSIPNPGGGTFFFTVIANHLRSLNGVDSLTSAHTRVKKQKQAESLATLIHSFETIGDPNRVPPYDNNIAVLGDMNAFQFNDGYVDVVGCLLGNPATADKVVQPTSTISSDMTALLPFAPASEQYSYSFDGDAQAIDHEMVNHSMFLRFSRIAFGRMNADYTEVFRNDTTRPERLSDHDPSVAYFDLSLASPTAANGNIAGRIVDDGGAPVAGATVKLSGSESRETITDSIGDYRFDNVETNGFYIVTPTRANYSFSPANRSFSLLGVHTESSFTASANGDRTNAIDTTEFFVRQQYLDFLGREPDPQGFNAWVNIINNCAPANATCDRLHVSESFFRSAEFQERGYFLYRFYATAFGRKPDYAEFAPDLATVSGFLTNDQLEAAKSAFLGDFMRRPEFAAQYNSLGNAAYVDTLINIAGVNLANRQTLIDSLNNGTLTRARVLRQVAESDEVYQHYYNQAFVVMEYFGYLHRDPDASYLNWLDVLNRNPADSRHMVEGFVNSVEYRARFAR